MQDSMQITFLPVDSLVPSKDNPRRNPSPDKLKMLTESIRDVGIQQPLLARPIGGGTYDLRGGARRLAAAKVAGLKRVPVIVREMTDMEAMKITVIENFHEGLDPLEEAKGLATLLEKGWDLPSIASSLGRSISWIARRISLNAIIRPWQELICDPAHDAVRVPTGILERLARLPADVQKDIYQSAAGDEWFFNEVMRDGTSFDQLVNREYLMQLGKVPWKLDDPTLHPKAGACGVCPKRSGASPLLWDDEDAHGSGKDRCLDHTCFREKSERFVQLKIDQVKREHPDCVCIADGVMGSELDRARKTFGQVVMSYDVTPAKKKDAGAVPAVVIQGKGLGDVRWIRQVKPQGGKPQGGKPQGGKPTPLKARRAALDARRQAWVTNQVRERLDELAEPGSKFEIQSLRTPSDQFLQLAVLIAAFGQVDRHGHLDGMIELTGKAKDPSDGWKGFDQVIAMDKGDVFGHLYRQMFPVMRERLQYFKVETVAEHYAEACRCCELLGVDADALWEKACNEIPEPKSWANLKKDGTVKTVTTTNSSKKTCTKCKKPFPEGEIINGLCTRCGGGRGGGRGPAGIEA